MTWGQEFRRRCPDTSWEALFYIADGLHHYPMNNYTGMVAQLHGWPLFFERFPLGQVWLVDLSSVWSQTLWNGYQQLAQQTGYSQKHPGGIAPQY